MKQHQGEEASRSSRGGNHDMEVGTTGQRLEKV